MHGPPPNIEYQYELVGQLNWGNEYELVGSGGNKY